MCEALTTQKIRVRVFAQAGVKDLKLVVEKTRDFIGGQPQVSGTSQQVLGSFWSRGGRRARNFQGHVGNSSRSNTCCWRSRETRDSERLMVDLGVTYANLEVAIITLDEENVNHQDAEVNTGGKSTADGSRGETW